VVKDGRAERRAVAATTGPGDSVTVTSGLAPGESVIVEGPAELADGMAVEEL
jgi:multidrug efflux pump subunit AcrA (membrane-fusion protein)